MYTCTHVCARDYAWGPGPALFVLALRRPVPLSRPYRTAVLATRSQSTVVSVHPPVSHRTPNRLYSEAITETNRDPSREIIKKPKEINKEKSLPRARSPSPLVAYYFLFIAVAPAQLWAGTPSLYRTTSHRHWHHHQHQRAAACCLSRSRIVTNVPLSLPLARARALLPLSATRRHTPPPLPPSSLHYFAAVSRFCELFSLVTLCRCGATYTPGAVTWSRDTFRVWERYIHKVNRSCMIVHAVFIHQYNHCFILFFLFVSFLYI